MPSQRAIAPATQRFGQANFRALYDAYFSFVWRCLRGLGVREPQLDDAVQEVFMVVHRRLPEFRGDSSVRTWIYAILRGTAANYRRGQRRKGSGVPLDVRLPDHGPGPEQRLQHRQQAFFVERFVAGLSDERRDVFVLALLDQLTIPEVAETLGIPLNTAYTRLRAVRLEFQKALKQQRDEL